MTLNDSTSQLQKNLDELTIKLVQEKNAVMKEELKAEINEILKLCSECKLWPIHWINQEHVWEESWNLNYLTLKLLIFYVQMKVEELLVINT